ncbi:MAG: SDR family NAD(P)-dependent oxidoreductase [Bacteroidota bacterium]
MAGIKTVLITGGSSGIGYAVSEYFAKAGYRILWASWLEEELQEAKTRLSNSHTGTEIHTLAIDLSKEESCQKVFDWTHENGWSVNVLINNAGFGTYGFLQDTDMDKEIAMINLHILSTYKLTRLFLNEMIKREEGTIINIASNSSFQPTPKLNTYASTKAFVNHFTRGLHEELKMTGSKVKAICVCPAAIRDTAFRKGEKLDKVKTFDGLATTTTAEVAKNIWNGFQQGKAFIVSGWKMRLLYSISWLIPYGLTQVLVKREVQTTD